MYPSFLLFLKICLLKRERDLERERASVQGGAEGEKQNPLSAEPDTGLDLTTLRSGPERK